MVRFQVLTATRMKMSVFRYVAPCSLVDINQHSRNASQYLPPANMAHHRRRQPSSNFQTIINLQAYKNINLSYGNESWKIQKTDERRLMSAEMHFMRRTVDITI
jgi:hypothetical protein